MIIAEFSRMVDLEPINSQISIEFVATKEECQALSHRFQTRVLKLESSVTIEPALHHQSFLINGQFHATLEQACTRSLDMFSSDIQGSFKVYFTPIEQAEAHAFQDEDQEFYTTPEVDVGEIIAQYLCMSIDQNPKITGMTMPNATDDVNEPMTRSPFADLAHRLKLDS